MQHPSWRLRLAVLLALASIFTVFGPAQMRERVWARYEHEMQDPVEDPPDALRKGDFSLGRLRTESRQSPIRI